MTSPLPTPTWQELRQFIESFIQERLQGKLDKLHPDEDDKRQTLLATHRREAWLADAARRVGQLQLVTHTLKPIHPDARGSNLHSLPQAPGQPGLAGSHELGDRLVSDVVGNAAALDVFKFLSLQYQGKNLLNWLTEDSAEAVQALSDNAEQAREWRQAFIGITAVKGAPASHSLAKQLYFPLPGSGYHLLAPLFPTSLVHHVHALLREALRRRGQGGTRSAQPPGVMAPRIQRVPQPGDPEVRRYQAAEHQSVEQRALWGELVATFASATLAKTGPARTDTPFLGLRT